MFSVCTRATLAPPFARCGWLPHRHLLAVCRKRCLLRRCLLLLLLLAVAVVGMVLVEVLAQERALVQLAV